ncbi:MAG TPA: MarR family transcriptional regulator [Trebonia sp.]|jgi:DNA-binding MarR family transcriptional regulator|nr:MarR family transcriptional regulator [Trebonia sp.]
MGSAEPHADEQSLTSAAAVYGLLTTLLRRAPRDISLTSLATLSTLDRAGAKRITELAAIEGVTQPSMTTLIAGLEKAGLVERSGDPNDRRVSMVSLTVAGRDYIRHRRQVGTETFATLVSELPPDEAAALAAAVPALVRLREIDNQQRDALPRAR